MIHGIIGSAYYNNRFYFEQCYIPQKVQMTKLIINIGYALLPLAILLRLPTNIDIGNVGEWLAIHDPRHIQRIWIPGFT